MRIRVEAPGDEAAIHELTEVAFAPVKMSDGKESQIVDKLRLNGDLVLSLVAVVDDTIDGHVAFSPVTISDAEADGSASDQSRCTRIVSERALGGS